MSHKKEVLQAFAIFYVVVLFYCQCVVKIDQLKQKRLK